MSDASEPSSSDKSAQASRTSSRKSKKKGSKEKKTKAKSSVPPSEVLVDEQAKSAPMFEPKLKSELVSPAKQHSFEAKKL